jgi:CubicO group peptidase (beta-lactamase class C family)
MRRDLRPFAAAALLAAALTAPPAHAQGTPAPLQPVLLDLFGEYLESLRSQAGIPGLAAAIVADRIVWEQAYGRQDISRAISTRTDTPFHVDGLTQLFTSALVLRCAEERRLSLADPVSKFRSDSAEPNATIGHLLSHTSPSGQGLTFSYRPERLEPLWVAVRACTDDSYRENVANWLNRLAMIDSVPGRDVISLPEGAEGMPDPDEVDRYTGALGRLAMPYAVDSRRRVFPSSHPSTTLTASTGLIASVRDFAQFDLALRQGVIVEPSTLDVAWSAPLGPDGLALSHGLGWFVQYFNGEKVVWQFGVSDNASSALVITLPARGLTLIMMANSDRLVRPFPLAAGDLTVSPFGKLFLSLFAR